MLSTFKSLPNLPVPILSTGARSAESTSTTGGTGYSESSLRVKDGGPDASDRQRTPVRAQQSDGRDNYEFDQEEGPTSEATFDASSSLDDGAESSQTKWYLLHGYVTVRL